MDSCYQTAFASDTQRVEFLFERYQQLASLLPSLAKPKRSSKPRYVS